MPGRLRTFDAYDPARKLPLGGYAAIVGCFGAAFGAATLAVGRSRAEPRIRLADVALLGIATHQLSMIAARDRVLAPFRAPFVKYEESIGAGELRETSRGDGLRKAIGDLVSCPYCMAPWVGSALALDFATKPNDGLPRHAPLWPWPTPFIKATRRSKSFPDREVRGDRNCACDKYKLGVFIKDSI